MEAGTAISPQSSLPCFCGLSQLTGEAPKVYCIKEKGVFLLITSTSEIKTGNNILVTSTAVIYC